MENNNPAVLKLRDYLSPLEQKFTPESVVYYVTISEERRKISQDNMTEHPCSEEYCEDCIDYAVQKKHEQFIDERNVLMGQLYEAEKRGFYTYFGAAQKDNKYKLRKIKVTPRHIYHIKRELRKKYRLNTLFSKEAINIWGNEHEGFRFCEGSCGKMFGYSLLLDSQELEHWEGLDDKEYKNIQPMEAYQLDAVLREGGFDTHPLHQRVVALAERIFKIIAL